MSQLSDEITRHSTIYLGPAAKLFLERQTKFHMNGLSLEQLSKQHLPELAKWVQLSAGLLIGKEKATELAVWINSR